MQEIIEFAKQSGYSIAWGSVELLIEIDAKFDNWAASGDFKTIKGKTDKWDFLKKATDFGAKTVVVYSVPDPFLHKIGFTHKGKVVIGLIPSGYMRPRLARKDGKTVLAAIQEIVAAKGLKAERFSPPLKYLSNRLGLTTYGRNNISYTEQCGSYHILGAVMVDGVLEPATYPAVREITVNPACENCGICLQVCPTGAIQSDRFRLHVDRCITHHNEAEEPWPEWLWEHDINTLIGCTYCQLACPINAGKLAEDPQLLLTLTEEETELVIAHQEDASSERWKALEEKLGAIGIDWAKSPTFRQNVRGMLKYRG